LKLIFYEFRLFFSRKLDKLYLINEKAENRTKSKRKIYNFIKMKQPKKLESLKSTIFDQNFSEVFGGHNPIQPPKQTGELRPIYKNGVLVGYTHAPEGPKNIAMSF
jgi:hypothetical protein